MTRFAARMESLLAAYSVSEIHDMAVEFSKEAMNDEVPFEGSVNDRSRPSELLLDGFTLEGFIRLFSHHGFESSRKDLREQYERIDTDGNGAIDKEEFRALVARISEDGLVRSPASDASSPQSPASRSMSPTGSYSALNGMVSSARSSQSPVSRVVSRSPSHDALNGMSVMTSTGNDKFVRIKKQDRARSTQSPASRPVSRTPSHDALFGMNVITYSGSDKSVEDKAEQRDSKMAVRELESEIKETWQMMYCGGAAPVVAVLKQIRDNYEINLEVESFDW